jgi:Icc-related predicted phosphoesterase
MKILFGSDFHGLREAYVRFAEIFTDHKCDVGVISGDLTTYVENPTEEKTYLIGILKKVSKPIFLIMGNDDGILSNNWKTESNVYNINLRKVKYLGFVFIGYCYTNPFVGGEFEKLETEQFSDMKSIRSIIEPNTILVTHGPAFGILDKASDGKHIGSKALSVIIEDERIVYHLFGHVHNQVGVNGKYINGSYPKNRGFYEIDTKQNTAILVK